MPEICEKHKQTKKSTRMPLK